MSQGENYREAKIYSGINTKKKRERNRNPGKVIGIHHIEN